jgi:hypothetical protein
MLQHQLTRPVHRTGHHAGTPRRTQLDPLSNEERREHVGLELQSRVKQPAEAEAYLQGAQARHPRPTAVSKRDVTNLTFVTPRSCPGSSASGRAAGP